MNNQDVLLFEKKGHIAYLTINRPERKNAISIAVAEKLDESWQRINDDDEIRVAILTGAGNEAFCAGMDLKELSERLLAGEKDSYLASKDPLMQNMRHVKKPLIAAVNGICAAGGFALAQNCDIRIAVEEATFSIREAKVGRGSPWAIPLLWLMPLNMALQLTLTGEPISASRAHEIGFINEVVPRQQLMSRVEAIASIIAENAPLSVMAAKESFYRAMDLGCQAGLEKAMEIYTSVYSSEDAKEGPRAFAEKRKPVWKGR